MQIVFAAAVVILMFVALPLWLVLWLRHKPMSEIMFGPAGSRKSRSGLGNALQELDRLVARPTLEYRVAAEDEDRLVEDETGGE